ncbi:P60-like family protein [Pseudohyphozyma bogoriensis]|nr:P60-like family protein [Pseudohyphozyma bogoriensis]
MAPRANSKKAGRKAAPPPPPPAPEAPLFEIDTVGSSSVRHSLLSAFSSADPSAAPHKLRKGQSINKPLKSTQILAARSGVPAVTNRRSESEGNKKKRVTREEKERMKRIVGREGKGEGLWGVKSGVTGLVEATEQRLKMGKTYDAWKVEEKIEVDEDEGLKKVLIANTTKAVPKIPSTLHAHSLLSSSSTPRAIPLPHPGTSYNPAHDAHQSLLSTALAHHTTLQAREDRGESQKTAIDAVAAENRQRDLWEMYEDEVGSGESDSEEEGEQASPEKKKPTKRKTRQQRTKKLQVAAEAYALAQRRAMKARAAAVLQVPALQSQLNQAKADSLEAKAAAAKLQKLRLAEKGLTRFRSGPGRVPDAKIDFQLGDELAENLRTLEPEGNLWKEWVGSGLRRGKVVAERSNEKKVGGKFGRGRDKGSKTKVKDKWTYKFGAQF